MKTYALVKYDTSSWVQPMGERGEFYVEADIDIPPGMPNPAPKVIRMEACWNPCVPFTSKRGVLAILRRQGWREWKGEGAP